MPQSHQSIDGNEDAVCIGNYNSYAVARINYFKPAGQHSGLHRTNKYLGFTYAK